MSYPYGSGDPLERPFVYAYAEVAPNLIDHWREARLHLLGEAEGENDCDFASPWFAELAAGIERGTAAEMTRLDLLIQRFEVTKRVYDQYDPDVRPPTGASHRLPAAYIDFAVCVELAYSATGRLTYLNALLKALDILGAIAAELRDPDRARVARLADAERRHVGRLQEAR